MNSFPKQAMILAAGIGKRMLPLTKVIPKPLAMIHQKPMLHHIIERCFENNVFDIIINTYHLHEKIIDSIRNSFANNCKIIIEENLLDTGGSVKNAINKKFISSDKLVYILNGDIYWIEDDNFSIFRRLHQNWNGNKMDILLVLKEKKLVYGYKGNGDFNFNDKQMKNGTISRVLNSNDYVFTGLQLMNPKILDEFQKTKFSLNDVFDIAIKRKTLYGIVDENRWFHIGTVKDLENFKNLQVNK